MPSTVALITLHGMGTQPPTYADEFRDLARKRLGADWSKVSFQSVYYQDILQQRQNLVFEAMERNARLGWMDLRKFCLFGLSDAASLEHHQNAPNSPYLQAQERILARLDAAFADAGNREIPVILIAHSLGCQVISSFIWDAQRRPAAFTGVWKAGGSGAAGTPEQVKFRRLESATRIFTTGCNIPLFVAGHAKIEPIRAPSQRFQWHNFYDRHDVLGWPLEPLSVEYGKIVRDREITVGRGVWKKFFRGRTPIAHTQYWTDPFVIRSVVEAVRQFAA